MRSSLRRRHQRAGVRDPAGDQRVHGRVAAEHDVPAGEGRRQRGEARRHAERADHRAPGGGRDRREPAGGDAAAARSPGPPPGRPAAGSPGRPAPSGNATSSQPMTTTAGRDRRPGQHGARLHPAPRRRGRDHARHRHAGGRPGVGPGQVGPHGRRVAAPRCPVRTDRGGGRRAGADAGAGRPGRYPPGGSRGPRRCPLGVEGWFGGPVRVPGEGAVRARTACRCWPGRWPTSRSRRATPRPGSAARSSSRRR